MRKIGRRGEPGRAMGARRVTGASEGAAWVDRCECGVECVCGPCVCHMCVRAASSETERREGMATRAEPEDVGWRQRPRGQAGICAEN